MAYFIKLKDTIYKVPNKLIVGRGEPFTVLNDDRSVSRSHLMLIKKNNKFYVKDLGSETGTVVQGKKVKAKKLIEVRLDSPILLGETELTILSGQPHGDFIEVHGSTVKAVASKLNFSLITSGAFLIFSLIYTYQSWQKGASLNSLLFMMLGQLFVGGIILFITSKIVKFFDSITPNQIVTDLYLSEAGFTVHYNDGSNMSFKKEKIESWLSTSYSVELFLYGEKYSLATNADQLKKLNHFLSTHLTLKKKVKQQSVVGQLTIIGLFSLCIMGSQVPSFYFASLASAAALILISIAMYFSQDLRKHWIFPTNKSFTKAKQTKSIIAFGFVIFCCGYNLVEDKKLMVAYEKCVQGEKSFCQEIDFHSLAIIDNKLKITPNLLHMACTSGNESACYYKKKRKVASE